MTFSDRKRDLCHCRGPKKWRYYFMGHHLRLVTNQKYAAFMHNTKNTSWTKKQKITRWRIELHLTSSHPGKKNEAAYALSRVCGSVKGTADLKLYKELCHSEITRNATCGLSLNSIILYWGCQEDYKELSDVLGDQMSILWTQTRKSYESLKTLSKAWLRFQYCLHIVCFICRNLSYRTQQVGTATRISLH